MANYVFIATSLNGYIATVEGKFDWIDDFIGPHHEDYGYDEFIGRIDAVVMGRVTFEAVLAFKEWPYPRPVFVLSRTLSGVPERLGGTDSLTKAKPRMQAPEAKPTTVTSPTTAQTGSPGTYRRTAHPAHRTTQPHT